MDSKSDDIKYAAPQKEKSKDEFRNYSNSDRQKTVENFYHNQHKYQSYEAVGKLMEKYEKLGLAEMSIWECLEFLDSFVDDSDPDTESSQMMHALQTAEAIRSKWSSEEYDWLPLTGLIHDLGKMLSAKGGEPQWFVVGDTFPVGCAFSDKCVFPQYFSENPDYKHKVYSTSLGVYKEHCGLDNVRMSYGHDEYLYQVCVRNGSTLPLQALYCIRFHSFYPWHREGQYMFLCDDQDMEMLKWVQEFNQFDLYSKSLKKYDKDELKPYYQRLIDKYFPKKLRW